MDIDFVEWPAHLQRMVPSYGQSMAQSAANAFEEGIIERRWYLLLTSGGA